MQKNKRVQRPGRRDELAQWYAEVLAHQASSGLSVAEYAAEIGVTASTLYEWRRRLKGQVGGGQPPSGTFGLVEVALQKDPQGRDQEAAGRSAGLVVRLGGDRGIEVRRGFDGDELRRLVTVLESC